MIGFLQGKGQQLRDWVYTYMASLGVTVTSFRLLGTGNFSFGLETAEQAHNVLLSSPIQYHSRLIHLWPWWRGFSTSSPGPRQVYFWMLFPGLPVEIASTGTDVEHLAKEDGIVVPDPTRLSYAQPLVGTRAPRVRVSSKYPFPTPLPTTVHISRGGIVVLQKVSYEGLPNQCLSCRHRGHFIRVCPLR